MYDQPPTTSDPGIQLYDRQQKFNHENPRSRRERCLDTRFSKETDSNWEKDLLPGEFRISAKIALNPIGGGL